MAILYNRVRHELKKCRFSILYYYYALLLIFSSVSYKPSCPVPDRIIAIALSWARDVKKILIALFINSFCPRSLNNKRLFSMK